MHAKNTKIHNQLRSKYTNIAIANNTGSKELKVLIVEDHPIVQKELAKTFIKLNESQDDYLFSMDMAFTCEEALLYLQRPLNHYDLVILDIKLPPFFSKEIYSGEDIGQWIKNQITPLPKIVIITYINDKQRIGDILQYLNPDALLIKDDITCDILLEAINNIFEQTPYYSYSASSIARKIISNNLLLDQLDKRLLYELSFGSTMKELVEILKISKSSIQKRKNRLMDIFGIKNNSVRDLVLTAKEKDFL